MALTPLFGSSMTFPPSSPHVLIICHTPPMGSYKINTNDGVKDGFTSGGGIIRDQTRRCIGAFSSFYGACLILEAKLKAVLGVSLLARGHGISCTWIKANLTATIH